MTEYIEINSKTPKLKVNHRFKINRYKNSFTKGYTENWSRETFINDCALKINPWTYKMKDVNGEKVIGSFYEKELLMSKLKISYYPGPSNLIRDKVKVVHMDNASTIFRIVRYVNHNKNV